MIQIRGLDGHHKLIHRICQDLWVSLGQGVWVVSLQWILKTIHEGVECICRSKRFKPQLWSTSAGPQTSRVWHIYHRNIISYVRKTSVQYCDETWKLDRKGCSSSSAWIGSYVPKFSKKTREESIRQVRRPIDRLYRAHHPSIDPVDRFLKGWLSSLAWWSDLIIITLE